MGRLNNMAILPERLHSLSQVVGSNLGMVKSIIHVAMIFFLRSVLIG